MKNIVRSVAGSTAFATVAMMVGACGGVADSEHDIAAVEQSVTGCTAPTFVVKTYAAGDQVQKNGVLYQCKPYPYTGWCGIGGPYEPGVGSNWSDAWVQVGACGSGGSTGTGAPSTPPAGTTTGGSSGGSVGAGGTCNLPGVAARARLPHGRQGHLPRQPVHRRARQPRLRPDDQHVVLGSVHGLHAGGLGRLHRSRRRWRCGRLLRLPAMASRPRLRDRRQGHLWREWLHRRARQPRLRSDDQHLVLGSLRLRIGDHDGRWVFGRWRRNRRRLGLRFDRQRVAVQFDVPGSQFFLHLPRSRNRDVFLCGVRQHRRHHEQEARGRGIPCQRRARNGKPRLHRRDRQRPLLRAQRGVPSARRASSTMVEVPFSSAGTTTTALQAPRSSSICRRIPI